MLYFDVLLAGAGYGISVCSWNCMPYLAPYVLANQGGFFNGLKSALLFSLGKLISYAFLGALAGYCGSVVLGDSWEISALVMLWVGYTLLRRGKVACSSSGHGALFRKYGVSQLIILGITAGTVPCLPLSGILLYAANTNSVYRGCLITVAFGLGTALSPLLFIAGGAGWFSKSIALQIPQKSLLLKRICGLVFIVVAIRIFLDGYLI